jgi:hypothetical protein
MGDHFRHPSGVRCNFGSSHFGSSSKPIRLEHKSAWCDSAVAHTPKFEYLSRYMSVAGCAQCQGCRASLALGRRHCWQYGLEAAPVPRDGGSKASGQQGVPLPNWTCTTCSSSKNFVHMRSCQRCGAARPGAVAGLARRQPKGWRTASSQLPDDWTCALCSSSKNFSRKRKCYRFGAARPSTGLAPPPSRSRSQSRMAAGGAAGSGPACIGGAAVSQQQSAQSSCGS